MALVQEFLRGPRSSCPCCQNFSSYLLPSIYAAIVTLNRGKESTKRFLTGVLLGMCFCHANMVLGTSTLAIFAACTSLEYHATNSTQPHLFATCMALSMIHFSMDPRNRRNPLRPARTLGPCTPHIIPAPRCADPEARGCEAACLSLALIFRGPRKVVRCCRPPPGY